MHQETSESAADIENRRTVAIQILRNDCFGRILGWMIAGVDHQVLVPELCLGVFGRVMFGPVYMGRRERVGEQGIAEGIAVSALSVQSFLGLLNLFHVDFLMIG